jgi:hypothetical protein
VREIDLRARGPALYDQFCGNTARCLARGRAANASMQVEAGPGHGPAMTEPALAETAEDQAYVTARFVPLSRVARPDAPFGVAIPAATYQLPDGTRWFARDVWRLADDAGIATPNGASGRATRDSGTNRAVT